MKINADYIINFDKVMRERSLLVRTIKRIIDLLSFVLGMFLIIPVAIIIKVSYMLHGDFAPIIYSQKRVGKNGKIFQLYKFRSMVPNADEVLKEILKKPEYKMEWDKYQKLSNDPRITKVGKLIRKTSLDEIPQFINVLKGDMSLIGPRPLVIGELDLHNGIHEVYEAVRPGITSWWAAHGRSNISYDERLKLEYYYIENRSLLLDFKCIFDTIKSIIKKDGAM